MLKFSLLLQAIDRVTAPAKRVQASMRGIGQAARRMAGDLDAGSKAEQRGTASATRLGSGLARLAGGFGAAGRAAKRWAGKAGLGSWSEATNAALRGTGKLAGKLKDMAGTGLKWGAAATAAAGGFTLFDVFSKTGEFEQFQAMLNRDMGPARGLDAMKWIQKFAVETPYELADVTAAFLQLRNYGIDPMDGSLRTAGDAASAMNRDLMSGVEALADAMTNDYERLKAFGITASTAGKKVTLSWVKDSKNFTRVVNKDAAAMQKAIAEIWEAKYGGSMKVQSTTFFGMISNLKDAWTGFLVRIGQAGIFDKVKNGLQTLLDKIATWAEDKTLDRWAKNISDDLGVMYDKAQKFITETDWDAVGGKIKSVAQAASALADGINAIVNAYNKLQDYNDALNNGNDVFERTKNLSDVYNNRPMTYGGKPVPKKWATDPLGPGSNKPSSTLKLGPAAAPAAKKKTAANDVNVGGKAVVDIRVTGPAQARVNSVQQFGAVPMQVNIGRVMAGAA